ncbi:hypothetical protein MLD38_029479 [Melastoma candidum]|uniref:Uncharacterized protein n=1 Tax=Melastoma candidum TaxID=119954 RepID=A0ACB9N9L7_9MYRT|nr:hypothetical protein MLD38_029479 [Melastoma candidum]
MKLLFLWRPESSGLNSSKEPKVAYLFVKDMIHQGNSLKGSTRSQLVGFYEQKKAHVRDHSRRGRTDPSLCKGADSIIFDRLAEDGRMYQEATTKHLNEYGENGSDACTRIQKARSPNTWLGILSLQSKDCYRF